MEFISISNRCILFKWLTKEIISNVGSFPLICTCSIYYHIRRIIGSSIYEVKYNYKIDQIEKCPIILIFEPVLMLPVLICNTNRSTVWNINISVMCYLYHFDPIAILEWIIRYKRIHFQLEWRKNISIKFLLYKKFCCNLLSVDVCIPLCYCHRVLNSTSVRLLNHDWEVYTMYKSAFREEKCWEYDIRIRDMAHYK